MSNNEMNHGDHSHKSKIGIMICYVSKAFAGVVPILVVGILGVSIHALYDADKKYKDLSTQIFDLNKSVNEKISLNTDKLDIVSNRTKLALSMGKEGGYIAADQTEKFEKLSDQSDKYYVAVLTREIMDKIDATENFQAKLDELEKVLEGEYSDYIAELRNYQSMNMLSFDDMVNVVEAATVADVPVEKGKSVTDNVKGLFKVSNKDDLKIKCNPIVIDSAVRALSEKNEWEALKTLEKVEPKNEDLKKVVENLNVRNTIKFYLRDIGDKVLKDA